MRRSVFIAGLVALSLGGAPALAFQEMPEPPPADVPAATPQLGPLQLGTPGGAARLAEVERLSLALYRFATQHALARGIIIADTKFDFGLDVMYGQDQPQLDLSPPITEEESGDVTVLGKVKRRF